MTTQMSRIADTKHILSPPGDTLLETIENLGISQTELAERMGRPYKTISEIIQGKAQITAETALQLETVLSIPASFWMERERRYRMEIARIKQEEALLHETDWAKQFPFSQMVKFGWIQPAKTGLEKVKTLHNFFQIAGSESWNTLYMKDTSMVNFRISLAHAQSPYAISAWLQKGDLEARQLPLPPFDKARFEQILDESLSLAFEEPADFLEKLRALCAEAGVALIFTPCLPKAPVSGCARWLGDRPIIQLSGWHKSNDRFWFTFFHEACHILKHGKKGFFLEEVEGVENPSDKEKEADQFATNKLVPASVIRRIKQESKIFESQVKDFARQFKIHPGILVGRLQHEGILKQNWLNKLKSTIELFPGNKC